MTCKRRWMRVENCLAPFLSSKRKGSLRTGSRGVHVDTGRATPSGCGRRREPNVRQREKCHVSSRTPGTLSYAVISLDHRGRPTAMSWSISECQTFYLRGPPPRVRDSGSATLGEKTGEWAAAEHGNIRVRAMKKLAEFVWKFRKTKISTQNFL